MKRILPFVLGLALMGCARVHLVCPTNGVEHFVIGGNNFGTGILAAGLAAGKIAGVMAPRQGDTAAPPPQESTIDYSYPPIFGLDYGECGAGPAPKAGVPTG